MAVSACPPGGVSASSALILLLCQCSCWLEESASHPTSPSLFGKGSAIQKATSAQPILYSFLSRRRGFTSHCSSDNSASQETKSPPVGQSARETEQRRLKIASLLVSGSACSFALQASTWCEALSRIFPNRAPLWGFEAPSTS